jgi:FAD/FMN-containing dehydrogenase
MAPSYRRLLGGIVMTLATIGGIDDLRAQMAGPVLLPGDADYDEARKIWNAEIDRRPAVIARCQSAKDVSAAVRFGVSNNLEIAVRGGAHGPSGKAVVDDGLMVDLSQLNAVSIDPGARRAKAGGGALLGDLQGAAQEHGLGLPVGSVGHTGVAGLTLGGGMGWLTHKHGLSIDNLVSVEIVTADGSILRASEDDNADLFWAIRGGGGNFGVVTEFEFQLHPAGPMIEFGFQFWTADQGKEFFRAVRDVAASLPDDVNVIIGALDAPPAPFVPEEHLGKQGYVLITTCFGPADQRDEVTRRMREAVPPLFEFAAPLPFMAVQTMIDEANAWGQYDYDKGADFDELTDEVIDIIVDHFPQKQSHGSVVMMYRLDRAFCDVPDGATAYSGRRTPGYGVFIIAVCPSMELLDADREWVRGMYDALTPHMRPRSYINAVNDDDANVIAVYGEEKYARLAQIKRRYDPENVFRRNLNIKPAPTVIPKQG